MRSTTNLWSEPSYTGSPDAYKDRLTRVARAVRLAASTPEWVCPRCHVSWPGVTRKGLPRKGCVDPTCRGRAGIAAANTTGANRQHHLPAETVQAIREAYLPGERGYSVLAEAFNVHRSTIQALVRDLHTQEQ